MRQRTEREGKSMAVKYVLTVLGIFLGDLRIKNEIESMTEEELERKRTLREQDGQSRSRGGLEPPCHGLIVLRRHHNTGAVLNFGQGRKRAVTAAALAMTAVLTVLFLLSLGQKGKGLLKTGLSLLLGGAFSNTYDRLKRGYVVDYFSLNLRWEPLRRVVFNLSDFCIMIGAMLVAIGA